MSSHPPSDVHDKLRILLVGDEPGLREELRRLLASIEDAWVVGEAAETDEAVELMRNLDYDLCFLDSELSKETRTALATASTGLPSRPAMILVSPDAASGDPLSSDVEGVVRKPLEKDSLAKLVDRLLSRKHLSEPSARPAGLGGAGRALKKIPIPNGDRTLLVDVDDVLYVVAQRGYSYVCTAEKRYLSAHTLSDLERRLGEGFFRAHRAYLVNLEQVKAFESRGQGGVRLLMSDDETLIPVSRRQSRSLRSILGTA